MERAFDQISDALDSGQLIGLFPEGAITNDGEMNAFRPGVERIVGRTPVPVIPLALRGLWGSFFSRKGGRAMSKPLRLLSRLWSHIALVAGPPIAATDVSAEGLHDSVLALRADAR
jgi:1-acyl-sn-glycerol-3-phosphate acyltransferase